LIFDLGAHVGADTAHYLSRGFRVVAVEANPDLAAKLKSWKDKRLTVEARALSSSPQPITLHLPDSIDVWGTTSPEQAEMLHRVGVKTREVTVPTVSLKSLIETYGMPYYIKCDIEGSDTEFLRMLSHLARKPETISFELTQVSMEALEEQLHYLAACGYSRFQLRDQRKLPPPPNGRVDGMWSGPFGADLAHETMLPFDQLCRWAHSIHRRNQLFGDFGLSRKLKLYPLTYRLAKLPPLRRLLYTSWYDIHCFS
jgi:FkbM family methyltransferase